MAEVITPEGKTQYAYEKSGRLTASSARTAHHSGFEGKCKN
ncbi:hypothetical protein JFJ30_24830 [Escherichia coli]|nr:hypothetical protein [Escherichia coli]